MSLVEDSSPICRGKNLTWETIILFFNNMPQKPMPKNQFNSFVESRIKAWTQTHSQIARQLAFYYEKDGICYPRFDERTTYAELFSYVQSWASKYFIPNPYAPSLKGQKPTCIYSYVVKAVQEGKNNFDEIIDSIFGIKLSSHDKLIVFLSNFTDILIDEDHNVSINDKLYPINSELYPNEVYAQDPYLYFNYFSQVTKNNLPQLKLHEREINPVFSIYLTALRTKPFMLLAGISGTGKSRIVREMAKACWKPEDDEYWKDKEKQIRNNHPRNFCMVQVKPNWHDSSELIGYVTRISGTPEFVPGPFLTFMAKAIKEPEVPYFLCLDEMNLAPVEQYFAEYLSVIESRKVNKDPVSGQTIIDTDPIIKPSDSQEYHDLIGKLLGDEERMKGTTLTIPQNLFVVGTVNMDETTFSFSRKVLDRAMTIEMNEVDLHGGLEKDNGNEIGYIADSIIGDAAEGSDVYEENKELCDEVLAYLEQVNTILEGTPFKIAYRTRNEFLMYAVNRQILAPDSQLWQTLDEMTSMKILSRIEGDSDRTQKVLERLKALVEEEIVAKMNNITGLAPSHPVDTGEAPVLPSETGEVPVHPSDTGEAPVFPGEATIFPSKTGEAPVLRKSISAKKIEEMLAKLEATGFTSYWA